MTYFYNNFLLYIYYFQMSKSIEDYRNIVKILKLKLMNLREENSELTRSMGVAEQKTNNHGLISRLEKQQGILAHNKTLLLTFCDKCEAIGLTPQKLYRIADSKRMRKISTDAFKETLNRIKLSLPQAKAQQLSNIFDLRRQQSIYLDDFLSVLSAYFLNTEKYPTESSRAYPQLALIKLSQGCDLDSVKGKLFSSGDTVTFEDFQRYAKKVNWPLTETELISVFLSMDNSQKHEVTRQTFVNCLQKVGKVVKEEGIQQPRPSGRSTARDKSQKKPPLKRQQSPEQEKPKRKQSKKTDEPPAKKPEKEIEVDQKIKKKDTKKRLSKEESDNQFGMDEETGVENTNKAAERKPAKQLSKQLQQATNVLRKLKLTPDNLITKLLEADATEAAPAPTAQNPPLRSFTIYDLFRAAESITKSPSKQDLQIVFKCMDLNGRGSISTCQVARFWLKVREVKTLNATFYKILKRQLDIQKITEMEEYFKAYGAKEKENLSLDVISKSFKELKFDKSEFQQMYDLMGKISLAGLVEKIKGDTQEKGKGKDVDKLDRNKTDVYDVLIKKIKPTIKQEDYFERFMRGQTQQQRWKTIFTNEWACWRFCYQTAKTIKSKWRDPEFGPSNQDKYGYMSMLSNISDVPPGFLSEDDVEWTTMGEFAKRSGQGKQIFYDKIVTPSDVVQGGIGDCWLISAMTIAAQKNQNFTGIPLQQILKKKQLGNNYIKGIHPYMFAGFRKYGIYVMKFYKQSKPVYVVVDELIPCQSGNIVPFCAHSPNPGLQWPAILEKAYAKLHHAYTGLISGDIAQGLADLTNCLPIKLALGEKQPKDIALYKKLTGYQQSSQMMGCSISPPETGGKFVEKPVKFQGQVSGLVYGHAYSITDVMTIPNKMDQLEAPEHNLMRVRNPWGKGEWVLDWSQRPSDPDPDNNRLKKHMEIIKAKYQERRKNRQQVEDYDDREDGTFMISFEDWSNVYTSLFLGLNLADFTGVEAQDSWSQKYPSGVCGTKSEKADRQKFAKNNIQYLLEVDAECEILLFIIQRDGRLYRGQKYPYKEICNPVALLVFKIDQRDSNLKAFDKALLYDPKLKLEARREVTFWKKFEKGKYVVIPATNSFEKGFESKLTKFSIKMYSNGRPKISRIGQDRKFLPIDQKPEEPKQANSIRELLQKITEIGI